MIERSRSLCSILPSALCLFLLFGVCNSERNCSYEPDSNSLFCSLTQLVPLESDSAFKTISHLILRCSKSESTPTTTATTTNLNSSFLTLDSLNSLSLLDCRLRSFTQGTFRGLSQLSSLTLSNGNDVSLELKKESLSFLSSLKVLNLSRNNIWSLQNFPFCDLSRLRHLNLSHNHLNDVIQLGFGENDCSSSPLLSLDLSFNHFPSLSSKALIQCNSLTHLNVSFNEIKEIEKDFLYNISGLKSLDLGHNELVTLPEEFLRHSYSISELYLEYNFIFLLAPGVFHHLEHLLLLNLSHNALKIDSLEPQTFISCHRLLTLDLSYNQLSILDSKLFHPLSSLQVLDLSFNNLMTLESEFLLHQNNLHSLKLDFNHLSTIHPRAFSGLGVLSKISLSHNNLSVLTSGVFGSDCCLSLEELILSQNHLTLVPELSSCKILKNLNLGENKLENLGNSSLKGLSSLRELNLSFNQLESFSNYNFFLDISNLLTLNLAHNKIRDLHQGVFSSLSKLVKLSLDYNLLTDINGLLSGLSELKELTVSHNQLLWFDYAFIPKNLRILDLSHNQIESLGNYYKLKDDFKLESLTVSNNKIVKMTSLSLPNNIKNINLSYNKIRSLSPDTFVNKSFLTTVDLRHNLIKKLQESSLTSLSDKRSTFFLGNNPFVCDCKMDWLLKIRDQNNQSNSDENENIFPNFPDIDDIYCSVKIPSSSILPLKNTPSSSFVCEYSAHCFTLCQCCAFYACDCRMQCPEGCSCFHDSSWTLNLLNCSNRNHTEIPPLIPMDATTVYLDGNHLYGILDSQSFLGRKRVSYLFLNSSHLDGINNQTLSGLSELKALYLQRNRISRLEGHEFSNLNSLRELYLENNRIYFISRGTFDSLVSLEILRLDQNQLFTYPIWELRNLQVLARLTLSNNPWSCECSFVQNFKGGLTSSSLVLDFEDVVCNSEFFGSLYLKDNNSCFESLAVTDSLSSFSLSHLPMIASALAILFLLFLSGTLVFVFRTPLRVWMYSKYGLRTPGELCSSRLLSRKHVYDAFISYSLPNHDFVTQILLPTLNTAGSTHYKMILQHRDVSTHLSLIDSLSSLNSLCATTILVVSKFYLEEEWSHIKSFSERNKTWKPILILLEELSSFDEVKCCEFKALAKGSPLIRWNETGFWNKLKFYLPDPYSGTSSCTNVGLPKQLATQYFSTREEGSGGWAYDGLSSSNPSSSTSTRSTVAGGSPRTLVSGNLSASETLSNTVVSNPNEFQGCWSSPHMYQSIGEFESHIYHTLEPQREPQSGALFDALGKTIVRLPNGNSIPGRYVRHSSGTKLSYNDVTLTLPDGLRANLKLHSKSSFSASNSPHKIPNRQNVIQASKRGVSSLQLKHLIHNRDFL